jgi:hypothetical protein
MRFLLRSTERRRNVAQAKHIEVAGADLAMPARNSCKVIFAAIIANLARTGERSARIQ